MEGLRGPPADRLKDIRQSVWPLLVQGVAERALGYYQVNAFGTGAVDGIASGEIQKRFDLLSIPAGHESYVPALRSAIFCLAAGYLPHSRTRARPPYP